MSQGFYENARQDAVKLFCRQALRGLGALNPEGRQGLLRLLVDTVVILDKLVEIHGVLPARVEPPPDDRNRPGPQDDRDSYDPLPYLIVVACT